MERFKIISEFVSKKAHVLDLGCGDGTLLDYLSETKHISGYGVEYDENHVVSCVEKGISVFQGNINEGLSDITDKRFDVAILSHTLQQVKDPLFAMEELCRVAKIGIVTFPNFAHWACRWQLLTGEIPKSKTLPHDWYNTPNIRVLSIKSFRRVCRENGFKIIHERPYIGQSSWLKYIAAPLSNILSQKGLFVIRK